MGKASLLLVLGFSTLFMMMGYNSNSVSNYAVENMVDYHTKTMAHNIAVSGANLAANEIFFDNNWTKGYSNLPFHNGTLDVNVEILDVFQNIRKLTVTGNYRGTTKNVEVILQPSSFSKFAYYSESEGKNIWWTNNDTVWGPFHTQDRLRSYRHSVFMGKASSRKKLVYYQSKKKDAPLFLGGYEKGVDLPIPMDGVANVNLAAKDYGMLFKGQDTVYLTFANDSLKYRFSYGANDTTVLLSSVAPNGVIFADNMTIRLKGTVSGQYSLGCSGTIYLDDDIVYETDQRVNPNSSDLLGIIATNEVLITDNLPNHSDINIHASIYCENGGFGADNYSSRPPSGDIKLLGGIIQHIRRPVGTFGKSGIKSGFSKNYYYDERLMLASPPMFPNTGSFEIVSWFE